MKKKLSLSTEYLTASMNENESSISYINKTTSREVGSFKHMPELSAGNNKTKLPVR